MVFYPEHIEYFKEELISEILVIPPHRPDILRVLDISVWPEVLKTHLVETKVGTSNEGQHLSGLKLVVDLKLKQKISYVADEPTQSVHAQPFEYYKSMSVILPEKINGVNVYDLVRSGRLQITPYIEAVKFRLQDPRSVHKCVMIFLDVRA